MKNKKMASNMRAQKTAMLNEGVVDTFTDLHQSADLFTNTVDNHLTTGMLEMTNIAGNVA